MMSVPQPDPKAEVARRIALLRLALAFYQQGRMMLYRAGFTRTAAEYKALEAQLAEAIQEAENASTDT